MKSHTDRLDFHWTSPAPDTTSAKNRIPSGPHSQACRVLQGGPACVLPEPCTHLLNDHHENTNIMVTYQRSILLLFFFVSNQSFYSTSPFLQYFLQYFILVSILNSHGRFPTNLGCYPLFQDYMRYEYVGWHLGEGNCGALGNTGVLCIRKVFQ